MKKHDEGYVLAYVTVVLLIFCLVAALILTGAMRNLNHQQDSIQQMKDQYVAEGLIEQVLAQLDVKGDITIDCNTFNLYAEDGTTVIGGLTASVENTVLTLVAQSGDVSVSYTLELSATSVIPIENLVFIKGLKSYTFTSNHSVTDGEGGLVE